jgi:hypothetical protein
MPSAEASYTDEMRKFLAALKFPSDEVMEDSLTKLVKEAVTANQLRLLTKDECEEIGLAEEATEIILKVCEKCPTYAPVPNQHEVDYMFSVQGAEKAWNDLKKKNAVSAWRQHCSGWPITPLTLPSISASTAQAAYQHLPHKPLPCHCGTACR